MSDCVNIFYLTTYNILDKYNNKRKQIGQYENFETVYKYLHLNTNALQQPGGAVGKFGLVKVKPASVPPSSGSRSS